LRRLPSAFVYLYVSADTKAWGMVDDAIRHSPRNITVDRSCLPSPRVPWAHGSGAGRRPQDDYVLAPRACDELLISHPCASGRAPWLCATSEADGKKRRGFRPREYLAGEVTCFACACSWPWRGLCGTACPGRLVVWLARPWHTRLYVVLDLITFLWLLLLVVPVSSCTRTSVYS